MDNEKIGALILSLRKEKGLTQKQLAERLNISDKTVSKWERGQGLPDISLMPKISKVFGIDIEKILEGEIKNGEFIVGNMKKTKYYVCPYCGNIITSIKEISISCCGRRLESLVPREAEESEMLDILKGDSGYYLTSDHPMTKDDYISFIAIVTEDRHHLIKAYPEWNLQYHISCFEKGIVMWYSDSKGLLYQKI